MMFTMMILVKLAHVYVLILILTSTRQRPIPVLVDTKNPPALVVSWVIDFIFLFRLTHCYQSFSTQPVRVRKVRLVGQVE